MAERPAGIRATTRGPAVRIGDAIRNGSLTAYSGVFVVVIVIVIEIIVVPRILSHP